MEQKCDVCGETKGVVCEILTKGENVDRVYHLCPAHWVEVYRRTLDDFLENSEYKVNSFIKMVADRLIVDFTNKEKMSNYVDEDDNIDMVKLKPVEVRMLRPYEDDGSDNDYE